MFQVKLRHLFKRSIRKILLTREDETFFDSLNRRKYKALSKFPHKKYSTSNIRDNLLQIGVTEGDCIMLHSSWRSFVGYQGKPVDVINCILDILGEKGTLLMPSNGPVKAVKFDVKQSAIISGVLSKVFCSMPNVIRSSGSHFSVAATGKLADKLTSLHMNSQYGFDDNSPYGAFCDVENAKVLFLGLGKRPTKISLFHRAAYMLKSESYYKKIFTSKRDVQVIGYDGVCHSKTTLTKVGVKNSPGNIKKIFSLIPPKYRRCIKVGHLDLVCLTAKPTLNTAIRAARKGLHMYQAR